MSVILSVDEMRKKKERIDAYVEALSPTDSPDMSIIPTGMIRRQRRKLELYFNYPSYF